MHLTVQMHVHKLSVFLLQGQRLTSIERGRTLSDMSTNPDVAPGWRKSRRSGAQGNCVEVCLLPSGQVGIRDSKWADGPVLAVSAANFAAWVEALRSR